MMEPSKRGWRQILAWGLGAIGWLSQSIAQEARPAERGSGPFTVPIYDRANPNRILALLTGVPAKSPANLLLSERQPLDSVRVEYYEESGKTNLVIQGTNCVFDARRRTAESPATLRVSTGDGRLELQGEGFTWWQTNNDLVISNQVMTKVRRPVTRAGAAEPQGTVDLHIYADRFRLAYASNRIVYTGHVRLEDPRMHLTCGTLTIVRSATNNIERMVAEEDVVITDPLTGGRTTGQTATYAIAAGQETFELTGNPRYTQGVRESSADRFVLDRLQNTLKAIGQARLVFPVGNAGAPGLLSLPGTGPPVGDSSTNRLIEVSAELITLRLPETNGPVRGVVAETNVVLLDRQDDRRATAQRAVYDAQGGLELTGDPVWSSGTQVLKGEAMRYEPTRQTFAVTGGTFLRLPVRDLAGPLSSVTGTPVRTNAAVGTNHFIDIRSRDLSYQAPWLRLDGGVQADYIAGGAKLGDLRCAALEIQYSNKVQAARATGGVRVEQMPWPRGDGGTTSKRFRCESLAVGFTATGQIDHLRADGGVEAEETETRSGGRPPVLRRLECESVDARFRGTSNLIDMATAEHRVVVSQDDRVARGERAQYTGTNSLLSLTGNPVVILPEGQISDAEAITWDQKTGKYRVTGRFKSRWKSLPLGTNPPSLPPIP